MHAGIPLFDPVFLSGLLREFRGTMRSLLFSLCQDLESQYPAAVAALGLPVDYFRTLGRSLRLEDYSNWKVVGWIEELNDLVYFLDVEEQLRQEPVRRPSPEFISALFAECEEQFYEHHYFDDLFPDTRRPERGLGTHLSALCARLARQVTQESLFFVPGLPCAWLARTNDQRWTVVCHFKPNVERAEQAGCLYVGLDGAYLAPPSWLRQELSKDTGDATIRLSPDGAALRLGRTTYPLPLHGAALDGGWRYVPPCWIRRPGVHRLGGLTLGATLVYGKNREPYRLVQTNPALAARLRHALDALEQAWPAGARLFATLTSRIVPLHASGVVSFSYRHRPGLSFINTFERDDLDLMDDLIHENAHHHLNLLLRKYRMQRGGRNQEIFYSPWRRSLRPLRGILHATFTFTMGALLFARLSSGRTRKDRAGRPRDLLRARFRGLEEIASLRYSIRDLFHAASRLQWVSASGLALVRGLEREIRRAGRSLEPFRAQVLRSRFGKELRRHLLELAKASDAYRLDRATRKEAGPTARRSHPHRPTENRLFSHRSRAG